MKVTIDKKKMTSGLAILITGAVAVSTVVLAAGGGPGGVGGGMGGGGGNMGQVEMSESVISVKLQTPTTGSLTRSTEFIGKLEPAQSVSVYPETSGKVTAVYYEAGQTVNKGDLLFTIDDSYAQLAYQIAQTSYDSKVINADTTLGSSYDSTILSAESSLKSAQQSLNAARLALKDYNDDEEDSLISAQKAMDNAYEKMMLAKEEHGENSAEYNSAESDYLMYRDKVNDLENDTDSELRSLRNSYKNAQTNYEAALAKYNLVKGTSLEDTQASVENSLKSAELSLEQSAKDLDKYKVTAPISGVIETKSVNLHENASTQTAAYTISNKDTMSVKFNASADAATALKIGDAVTLTKSGKEYSATIIEIDAKADDSTGLFPIKARIEGGDGTLLSGVTVKVTAATQKAEDALLVPIDLVYYDEGQAYVFTYSGGKARRTDIVTGMSNSEYIVAESGLSLDSQIITTWHPDMKDGAAVELAQGQADPEAGSAAADRADAAPGPESGEAASKAAGADDEVSATEPMNSSGAASNDNNQPGGPSQAAAGQED